MRGPRMTNGNLHQIWVEQCVAAETIKLRYGLKAAFDYAVAEKLLNFAEAAAQHPEFARELPRFVWGLQRRVDRDPQTKRRED